MLSVLLFDYGFAGRTRMKLTFLFLIAEQTDLLHYNKETCLRRVRLA